MAEQFGLELERPRVATLTQLEASEDQRTFRCFFDTPVDAPGGGGQAGLSLEADLMVAAEAPDTSPDMLALLTEAGARPGYACGSCASVVSPHPCGSSAMQAMEGCLCTRVDRGEGARCPQMPR